MPPESGYGYQYGSPVGQAVIKALGGRVTPEKMRFFEAWAKAEGTKARYNPFATTRRGFPGETQFNQVGVKNYPDLRTGIRATIDTLRLNYYTHIVDLLKRDDVTAEQLASAVADSPWGTGAGVLRVLGVKNAEAYEKAQSTAQYGAKKAQVESYYQTVTLDRFRPSEQYLSFLSQQAERNPALAPVARAAQGFQPFTQTTRVDVGGDEGPTADGQGIAAPAPSGKPGAFTPSGDLMVLPTSWKGTHITDNLDLNAGQPTATDIMGKPGTRIGAPESGRIVRHGGAQGGQAVYFQADSGALYWIGHIDDMPPVGTEVKRGGYIGVISADHPRPHVHLDKRPPRRGSGR